MDMIELKNRMKNGKLYNPNDERLLNEQLPLINKVKKYNSLDYDDFINKQKLLKEMFGKIGNNCFITQPFYANWGGKNVYFGNNIYANFNLTLVDDGEIYVGDKVMFGPNVTLVTATHPINPELRKKQIQYNKPIKIEQNVWIGANVTVLPGVTIGENSVIGAGSIVTKNIPANVVAVGSPCKVLRLINKDDKIYYDHNKLIDIKNE